MPRGGPGGPGCREASSARARGRVPGTIHKMGAALSSSPPRGRRRRRQAVRPLPPLGARGAGQVGAPAAPAPRPAPSPGPPGRQGRPPRPAARRAFVSAGGRGAPCRRVCGGAAGAGHAGWGLASRARGRTEDRARGGFPLRPALPAGPTTEGSRPQGLWKLDPLNLSEDVTQAAKSWQFEDLLSQ